MCTNDIEPINIDGVSLVGIRINPESDKPDLYTLMTYGANEIPLVLNDRIAFFKSPSSIGFAYNFFSDTIKRVASVPEGLDVICDVAGMMYIIKHEDSDESATVLNCLNTIFDLVAATPLRMPAQYKKVLYGFADHLTFQHEFATYLEQQAVSRDIIIDAILWCIGTITLNSTLIDNAYPPTL